MKRSIAVVAAGRGLTILWVFVTAQVILCQATIDEDIELYKAISENKIELVTQMITNKGLKKASRQLNISPLIAADMNPTTDDDDEDDITAAAAAAEKQKQQNYRRPSAPAPVAPEADNTGRGIYGERPAETPHSNDDRPVLGNVESQFTNHGDQNSGGHLRRLNSVPERPSGRRLKSSKKRPEDSRPVVMV